MANIFHYGSTRAFIDQRLKSYPRHGRGQRRKLAFELNVSTSYLSQIMTGKKPLDAEKAVLIARFLKLDELETRILLCRVQLEEAGNPVLKEHYLRQLKELKEIARGGGPQPAAVRLISKEEEARLYSYWYYSAVHLCTSIPGLQQADQIADRLQLPTDMVSQVLDFLEGIGLCNRSGRMYRMNKEYSLISTESFMLNRLLRNWRDKGAEHLPSAVPNRDLFTSLPVAIDSEGHTKIRKILLDALVEIQKTIQTTRAKSLYCLNIDWFEV